MNDELPETNLAPRIQARIDACIAALDCSEDGSLVIQEPEFLLELRRQLLASQDPAQVRAVQMFGQFLITACGAETAGQALLIAATVRVGHQEGVVSDDDPAVQQVKAYLMRFASGGTQGLAPSVDAQNPDATIPAHILMQHIIPTPEGQIWAFCVMMARGEESNSDPGSKRSRYCARLGSVR